MSVRAHLLPPWGHRAESRSATRAAKGSKRGPLWSQHFTKMLIMFALFCSRDQIGSRRRPEPSVVAKNQKTVIGGTKNDRESDAKHQKYMNMHHNSNVRTKQQLSILTELPKLKNIIMENDQLYIKNKTHKNTSMELHKLKRIAIHRATRTQ